MGNPLSKEACIFLCQLPAEEYIELLQETFTVVRTDGRIQEGWTLSGFRDPNRFQTQEWIAANAVLQGDTNPIWKMFMVRYSPTDVSTENHLWGWRSCIIDGPPKFWPSRLTGDEEKDAWRTSFYNKLKSLKIYGMLSEDEKNRIDTLQEKCDLAAKKAAEDAGEYKVYSPGDEDLKIVNLHSQVSLDAIIAVIRYG